MTPTNPADNVNPVLNVAMWVFVVALAFVNVFVTFRGLASPAAMEQAIVGRELARGNGFSTKVIKPAAIQQMQASGHEVDFGLVPDTSHPPLYPALLSACFKAMKNHWAFDRGSTVYALDRVAGCVGACCMLLTLVLAHGIAKRMFDRTLAAFAVLALATSKPLWEVCLTMGARGLLVVLTTLCFYWLVALFRRAHAGEPPGVLPIAIGLMMAAMVLTHWMAIWIVLGVVIATAVLLKGHRLMVLLFAILPMLAISGWCMRNYQVCGDFLGATKATMQSLLTPQSESTLLRDYENVTPPVNLTVIARDINSNVVMQTRWWWDHMLGVVPSVLFFLALLHRFRRPDVGASAWAVAFALIAVIAAGSLFGLPAKAEDDNQVHAALVPMLAVFGLAGFAVLWARFSPGRIGIWQQHGYAILAIVIGGWPMIAGVYGDLRVGLFFKDQLMQWPPYRPDTISRLNALVESGEQLGSDAPWAVAWYADRTCLWLPKNREQWTRMTELAKQQKHPFAGFVVTPLACQDANFLTQFEGPYGDWMELIARGPLLPLGPELQKYPSGAWMRDFMHALPLGVLKMPDGRRVPAVTFYSNRDRWSGGQLQ